MFSSFVAVVYVRQSHCICQMTYCLFAISPLASDSNSADRLMLLNQLLTERSNERRSPQKSAFKTKPLFFVQGIARGNVLSAFPHELSVTAGKNIYRLLHGAQLRWEQVFPSQMGTSLPISFCSGVDPGNALAEDLPSDTLRSAPAELQPCGELCLCIHSAGCHGDAAHFRPVSSQNGLR